MRPTTSFLVGAAVLLVCLGSYKAGFIKGHKAGFVDGLARATQILIGEGKP